MILYNVAVGAGTVVEAWLLALMALRGHRTWLKATYAALALTFIINGAAYVGTTEGLLTSSWQSTVLWSMILAHPLTAILVLSLIHGETLPRRRPMILLLLLAVPELSLLTPSAAWGVQHAYEPNPIGAFLIVCLGIALAEPLYVRLTSSLLAVDSFWLSLGVVALIVGGPIYNYEFDTLGLSQAAGANVGAPIALAVFAYVALHADPFPIPKDGRRPTRSVPGSLPEGVTLVFEEKRPSYALDAVRVDAAKGRPVLVIARQSIPLMHDPDGPVVSPMHPTRHGGLRTLATASEFLTLAPRAVIAIPDLADITMMCGWEQTKEMVLRLRQVAKDTKATLILSTARLTDAERRDLKSLPLTWWTLPDAADEIEALLARSFGPGAHQLVSAFTKGKGFSRRELTVEQIPTLVDFLNRVIGELSGSVADAAATHGLHAQAKVAIQDLRSFAARSPENLARGEWPSKEPSSVDRDLVVTAADYWKGKEMDELFAAAQDMRGREPLYERARSVFMDHLGDVGESLLKSELAKLGKKPGDLQRDDVARLADRTAVDLGAMADVVDIPQEQDRLRSQIDAIRRRLEAIAGDQS